jgi:pre-mRNA-splicing factor 38B
MMAQYAMNQNYAYPAGYPPVPMYPPQGAFMPNAPQVVTPFVPVTMAQPEPEEEVDPAEIVEMKCDRSYNLNSMLATNIAQSDYFKSLLEVKRFDDMLDEIWNSVEHLEPMALGKARMPSTAFTILYRLFTMRLTSTQLQRMLDYKENALTRGLGFLYLRFVHPPDKLWDWFEKYIDDTQKFQPGGVKEEKSMGEFARAVLEDMKYYGTLFPRIPVLISREIKKKILIHDTTKGQSRDHESFRGDLEVGRQYQALYSDGKYYDVVINAIQDDGKFLVTWADYGNQDEIEIGAFKKPESSSSSSSSSSDRKNRSRSRSRGRSSRSRSRGRKGRSRSRSRDRDRDASKDQAGEKNFEQEILRREREAAAATGKDYARKPVGYKKALSLELTVGTARKRSRSPAREDRDRRDRGDRDRDRERRRERRRSPSPPKKKEMSDQAKQQRAKLIAVYGDASSARKPTSDFAAGPSKAKGQGEDLLRLGFQG